MKTTSENVLANIEHENERVQAIRDRLFTVYDIAVPTPESYLRKLGVEADLDTPDTQLVYNSNGSFLGHAKGKYQSLQPQEFFERVVQSIEGCEHNLDLSNLEYREIKDGQFIEFRLPTEIISFKNARGKQDETKLFVNFWTGFGGMSRSEMGLYSKRLICSNGMKIIQSETELKAKHTVKMNAKMLLYCESIMQTVAKVQETSKLWKEMNSKEVDSKTVEAFTNLIAGVKKDETLETMSTKKKNILDKVKEAVAIEIAETGATVWGLLNGATRYTNHFASGHDNEDYILVDTGAKVNQLAQREAIALLN